MPKLTIILILIAAFLVSLWAVNAEIQNLGTFEINKCVELKQLGAGFTNCTLTSVMVPNGTINIINTMMDRNIVEYNYTYCTTPMIGSYIVNGYCSESGGDTVWNYNFDVTTTGKPPISPTLIIAILVGISILAIIFIVTGIVIYARFKETG